MRPLKKGELFCYYGKNPIEIAEGKTLQVELPCYARGAWSTFPETASTKTNEPEFGIRGVTDANGKPVGHVYVIAFKGEKDKAPMPNAGGGVEYLSMTDKDGNYLFPWNRMKSVYPGQRQARRDSTVRRTEHHQPALGRSIE